MESPLMTKAALATPAPAIPIEPHKSQAGKNAPNSSKDGAPFVEQPPRQTDARQRRARPDRVRHRAMLSEAKDTRVMAIGNARRSQIGITYGIRRRTGHHKGYMTSRSRTIKLRFIILNPNLYQFRLAGHADAVDAEQVGKPCAFAMNAALDGAGRANADDRGIVDHENQGLALVDRQLHQRGAELLELDAPGLLRPRYKRLRIVPVDILQFALPFTVILREFIAQNRKQPRRHVGAGLERADMRERPQQRLLHQVVGAVDVAAKRNGERTQARHGGEYLIAYHRVQLHRVLAAVSHDHVLSSRRTPASAENSLQSALM